MSAEQDVKTPETDPEEAPKKPELRKPKFSKVSEIHPNRLREGFNIIVKLVSDPEIFIERLYLDGTTLKIASVVVADDTACISLHLKDGKETSTLHLSTYTRKPYPTYILCAF